MNTSCPDRAQIFDLAYRSGAFGFTADDVRAEGIQVPNLGAVLGSMRSAGVLRRVCYEPSRSPSRKGARIERFALAVGVP